MTTVDDVVLNSHHLRNGDKILQSIDSTFSHNDHSDHSNHRHQNVIDYDASLHPIGLIDEWIAAIKEETRLDEEEWRMNMKTRDTKSTIQEEDTGEWDVMMAEVDEELDNEEALEDNEDEEWESTLSGGLRKMQSSGGCVQNADGLQSAVRGSSPSKTSRITVCTQRMKLGSTARRRLQKQPAVYGVVGGGINFSDRQIILRCQYIRKKCILDGEEVSRIFYGTNVTLYLIGFQFSNATAYDKFGSGSALTFLENSVITIRDCSFIENKAKRGGGAVLLQDSVFNLRNNPTSRTRFIDNTAQFGGAIFSINSTIQTILFDQPNPFSLNGNQARSDGGAIYMINGQVTLSNFGMDNNVANNGGAGVFIGVDMRFENVKVTNNQANGVAGGLYFNNSEMFLKDISVQNNTANSTGGILFVSSKAYLLYSVFDYNKAAYDGGATTILESDVGFYVYEFSNNTGGSPALNNNSIDTISSVTFSDCP